MNSPLTKKVQAKVSSILFVFITVIAGLQAGNDDTPFEAPFLDGPYVLYYPDQLLLLSVNNQVLIQESLPLGSPISPLGKNASRPLKLYSETEPPDPDTFADDRPIFAISDIHGQYQLLIRLLEAHQIIDRSGKWSFGNGHFVVVGDIFDRGAQVTQVLWFLYQLEQEAKQADGMVSVLLGNHELMNLSGNQKYVHDLYLKQTVPLTQRSISELYGPQSEPGRWLRRKNGIIRIGKRLFVHGGLESQITKFFPNLHAINQATRAGIGQNKEQMAADLAMNYLFGKNGPFWYRGYFPESIGKPAPTRDSFKRVLLFYGATSIVVGHTTQDQIETRMNGNVIAIDAGLKNGITGEALLIQDGKYSRCLLDGRKVSIP